MITSEGMNMCDQRIRPFGRTTVQESTAWGNWVITITGATAPAHFKYVLYTSLQLMKKYPAKYILLVRL